MFWGCFRRGLGRFGDSYSFYFFWGKRVGGLEGVRRVFHGGRLAGEGELAAMGRWQFGGMEQGSYKGNSLIIPLIQK